MNIQKGFGNPSDKNFDPSLFNRAIADMQEKEVVFVGEGKNTYQANGEFYAMGRKVSEQEYNKFLEKFNTLKDLELEQKRSELN